MDLSRLHRQSEWEWHIPRSRGMRVPGVIFGSEKLLGEMDPKVEEQVANVATLPGIVTASYAMPDAHWGYGFPIGGVGAFDAERGGVVSAGGVGFDISCGVRTLHTGLSAAEVGPLRERLADALFGAVPAGVGSRGRVRLDNKGMNAMLAGGARWAVEAGYGTVQDLARIESGGCMEGAKPGNISPQARTRQTEEMGTLGSGNHYLEVQHVTEVYDPRVAQVFGIKTGDVLLTIHCGSRGLGHQVATEFSKTMLAAATRHGIALPERELACAPIRSEEGEAYLGAMRAAINCALANRQIIAHLAREVFSRLAPKSRLSLLYDVSHNTCSLEEHRVEGKSMRLFVHRKGATRALGPGQAGLPPEFQAVGQPVLIGGTMGTASYILVGTARNETLSFRSACHGAGRAMSRSQATRKWQGRDVMNELEGRAIAIRTQSYRGLAEEAPGAYKDVSAVVEATHAAGLAAKVARVLPLACVKG